MKRTGSILDEIVAAKRDYLRDRKLQAPLAEIKSKLAFTSPQAGPGFYFVLKLDQPSPKLIAEVKKASPSSGVLRTNFSVEKINQAYQASDNVVAISVITEHDYFQGGDDVLTYFASHNTHQKPLLRKDFIVDPYQVFESKLLGAQAYLLVASLTQKTELQDLVELGLSIGIEPLVEVHNETELEIALSTKTRCIGVNARDLATFKIDNGIYDLLRNLDGRYARVAESGIESVRALSLAAEYSDAALVGSYFMRAPQISTAIYDLIEPTSAGRKQ